MRRSLPPLEAFNFQLSTFDLWSPISRPDSRPPAPLTFCPAPFTLHSSYLCISPNLFRHLDLQISLDKDRNHVVTYSLIVSLHLSRAPRDPGRSPLQAASLRNLCVRRLPRLGRGIGACPEVLGALDSSSLGLTLNLQLSTFNRVSFPSSHLGFSQRSAKSFVISTSMTPFPQPLYNPHLRAPLGSAGNKGLITPLESALTKNSPVTSLESALIKKRGVPLDLWHSHSCVQSHDILYVALSGHPLHFASARVEETGPRERAKWRGERWT